MISRSVKRPKVGQCLDVGRYGVSVVLQVFLHGRELKIRDRLDREWFVSRAPHGAWVYPDYGPERPRLSGQERAGTSW